MQAYKNLFYKNFLIFVVLSISLVSASKPMADFVGTYEYDSDDGNFDAFLKEMGKSKHNFNQPV